ncbi:MAG: hypothetical protein CMP39_02020 [Rickettsiales bacterium]|nr:hypothetical protein [Rickettsiales bacterium]
MDTDTNTTYTAASAGGLSLSDTAFSLDISGLGDIGTSGATTDTLAIYDTSADTEKEITIANLQTLIDTDTNTTYTAASTGGLSLSNTAFSLNVAGLTADTNAGNVLDAIAISDASDSNSMKKITISQLKTLVDTDTNTQLSESEVEGFINNDDLTFSNGVKIIVDKISVDEIRARDGDDLKLYDNDGSGLIVEDGGNVGIGLTDPTTKLDVNGTAKATKVETAEINYTETAQSASSSTSIDWSTATHQKITNSLTSGTISVSFSNPPNTSSTQVTNLVLIIKHTGSGAAVTFPSAVKWPGGVAPTISGTANRAHIVSFYYSGGEYYGNVSFDYY